MEPQKPFACTIPDCGLAFTNEDHLNVHTKKHDMALELGTEQKAVFVADQTPTPTRFIRNCEEVGLFQDLQNVNPFDEGFKRAMESKVGVLSLDAAVHGMMPDDVLHTPQMTFPNMADAGDPALFCGNLRNIAVSRSSNDETGAIKEYETTTISKLTNEVTTISRVFGKEPSTDDHSGGKETVSYTNNVIQIHSNVEIRKDQAATEVVKPVALIEVYSDSVIKDTNVVTKDVMFTDSNKLQVPEKLPMMSQKSIDFVVDSLTNGTCSETIDLDKEKESLMMLKKNLAKKPDQNSTDERPRTVIKLNEVLKASNELKKQKTSTSTQNKDSSDEYEVIIKLPNRKTIRMKAIEEEDDLDDKRQIKTETKEKLKQALFNKADKVQVKPENQIPVIKRIHGVENDRVVPNIVTLYPVTIVNPNQPILLTNTLQKVPIPAEFPFKGPAKSTQYSKKVAIKRASEKNEEKISKLPKTVAVNLAEARNKEDGQDWNIANVRASERLSSEPTKEVKTDTKTVTKATGDSGFEDKSTFAKHFLERRSAASRRYRERLKRTMQTQRSENQQLREQNQRLRAANSALKSLLTKHLRRCPCPDDLQSLRDIA